MAAAYRRLRSRGIVEADRRRGTRVRQNPASPATPADEQPVADGLIDLAGGNPDAALLPSIAIALPRVDGAPSLYGESPMLAPLVSFAAAEFAADGIDADHLTITSGALDAIERLLREHLRPGDRVAVEDPSLPALLDLIGASGFSAVPVAVDAEGPLPDDVSAAIERGVRALILTPRGHNPTGAVLTPARAAATKRALRGYADLLVIESDPCGPVAGAPYTTATGDLKRWAVVRSVSKFLGPDLRLAIVCGDALTIARLQGRQSLGCRWVSRLLQQVTLALWSDPSSGRRLAHAADVYSARRTALRTALAASGVAVESPSGFNVWIPVREETTVVLRLAQRGWAVAPGARAQGWITMRIGSLRPSFWSSGVSAALARIVRFSAGPRRRL